MIILFRWHQLGAFYPFARNHNAAGTELNGSLFFHIYLKGMVAQDPANLGEEAAGLIRLEIGAFY